MAAPALLDLPFLKRANFASDFVAGGFSTALGAGGPAAAINGLYWMVLPLLGSVLGVAALLGLRRGSHARPGALVVAAVFYGVVAVRFQSSSYLAYTVPATLAGLVEIACRGSRRWRVLAAAGTAALATVALVFHAGQSHRREFEEVLAGVRVPAESSAALPRCGLRIDRPRRRRLHRRAGPDRARGAAGRGDLRLPQPSRAVFPLAARQPLPLRQLRPRRAHRRGGARAPRRARSAAPGPGLLRRPRPLQHAALPLDDGPARALPRLASTSPPSASGTSSGRRQRN